MNTSRRRFLRLLGIGGATVAAAPVALAGPTVVRVSGLSPVVGSAQEAYDQIATQMYRHVDTHRMINYFVTAQTEVGWVRYNGKTIGK